MKKQTLNSLSLNKKSIASLKKIVKGGVVPIDHDICSSFGNGECYNTGCNCEKQQF